MYFRNIFALLWVCCNSNHNVRSERDILERRQRTENKEQTIIGRMGEGETKEKTMNKSESTMNKSGIMNGSDAAAEWKKRGCMPDYRFDDLYNIWLITRNGKLSADQLAALSEAADRFGSGQVKITPRQIVSVEGVKEEELDAALTFLEGHGLMADSSEMLVRPVTACMGTTCKNGLIDTDSLCERLFDRFFTGWAGVELPQKFKIGISGCPNNCAKADLNDVGIIGRMTPGPDYSKCRSCTVCQVEKACRKTHAAAKLTEETLRQLWESGYPAENQQQEGKLPCMEEGKALY